MAHPCAGRGGPSWGSSVDTSWSISPGKPLAKTESCGGGRKIAARSARWAHEGPTNRGEAELGTARNRAAVDRDRERGRHVHRAVLERRRRAGRRSGAVSATVERRAGYAVGVDNRGHLTKNVVERTGVEAAQRAVGQDMNCDDGAMILDGAFAVGMRRVRRGELSSKYGWTQSRRRSRRRGRSGVRASADSCAGRSDHSARIARDARREPDPRARCPREAAELACSRSSWSPALSRRSTASLRPDRVTSPRR
jgi:hypothetical protein